jgi:hypothetical protein
VPHDLRLPGWARWSAAAAERPWTVGVEEEVMLLDPLGWKPANRIDEALLTVADDLRPHLGRDARLRRRAADVAARHRRLARG